MFQEFYGFTAMPFSRGLATSKLYVSSGQEELKALMQRCGFGHVDYHNLTGGVVALHAAIKC